MRVGAIGFAPVLLIAAGVCAQTLPATQPGRQPGTQPARLPVPGDAAQDARRLTLVNTFKGDLAKTDAASRQAFARRLLAQAVATNDDPVMRYVALQQAQELAGLAGDPETAFRAAAETARLYVVDPIDIKKRSLFQSNAAELTAEGEETVSRLALDTAEEAAQADDFTSAEQLVNVADAAAEKTRRIPFIASIQVRLADLRALVNAYPRVKRAMGELEEHPENAALQLDVGRFYALQMGRWEKGLPYLAKGSDEVLRGLALRDLAAPTQGTEQDELANAWWDYGETCKGSIQRHVREHARGWYRLAEKNLKGITLAVIESRLKEGPGEGAAGAAEARGTGVNLLALIDTTKDVVEGKWGFSNGVLECTAPSRRACVAIPYAVPDEYDLRVTFVRTQGEGPVTVLLAGHGKAFDFTVDAKGFARFERVANKIAKDNPTAVPVVIANGRRYTVTVQIRQDRIAALLDGKLLVERKTDYKELGRYSVWKMPDEKLCGIGANNSKVSILGVELVEVAGKGHATR